MVIMKEREVLGDFSPYTVTVHESKKGSKGDPCAHGNIDIRVLLGQAWPWVRGRGGGTLEAE